MSPPRMVRGFPTGMGSVMRGPCQPHLPGRHAPLRNIRHLGTPSDGHGSQLLRAVEEAQEEATDRKQGSVDSRQWRRDALLGMSGLILGAVLGSSTPAQAGPFLKDTGGRGPLAQEEERMYNYRLEKEAVVREGFDKEVRMTQDGKLCATPFGVDVVGITEAIALLGALVAGISARQRKAELELLNERLRKINMSLRQNARSGIVYAPGLTYAPPVIGSSNLDRSSDDGGSNSMAVSGVVDAPPGGQSSSVVVRPPPSVMLNSLDEEMSEDQIHCSEALKEGKKRLKEGSGSAAMVRFEKALMLSKGMKDRIQERRAMRGLAAAARLQGQYRTAIRHLEQVLDISSDIDDHIGDADAYGTIADIYTEMGEFEKAASYYDKYISTMNTDGPV
ncbi:unnamed protein product [Ostreobium quekettii]|uniref:Tetratricopeptide repeat n=1 Tax=Ostreobium quekettii TaxID=121088 RepID=A0A8S1J1C5_9CHLO|nr:unnamed protein product [Ostreobium quekettii]